MSIVRETRRVPVETTTKAFVVDVSCDACGKSAWYPAHRRAHCVVSRIQDDDRGNMDIWDLDLCEDCKDQVMDVLRSVAAENNRELPNTRSEEYRP